MDIERFKKAIKEYIQTDNQKLFKSEIYPILSLKIKATIKQIFSNKFKSWHEDLFQYVFASLIARLHKLENHTDPEAFLFVYTKYEIIQFYRNVLKPNYQHEFSFTEITDETGLPVKHYSLKHPEEVFQQEEKKEDKTFFTKNRQSLILRQLIESEWRDLDQIDISENEAIKLLEVPQNDHALCYKYLRRGIIGLNKIPNYKVSYEVLYDTHSSKCLGYRIYLKGRPMTCRFSSKNSKILWNLMTDKESLLIPTHEVKSIFNRISSILPNQLLVKILIPAGNHIQEKTGNKFSYSFETFKKDPDNHRIVSHFKITKHETVNTI